MIHGIVHDTGAADGILVDSISKALEVVERDKPRHFVAWLFSIARNMARHWVRDRKLHEKLLDSEETRLNRSAFAETITQEAFNIFERDLELLSEAQRRALLLRLLDRMSCDEIAREMGIASGAVRALIHRAKLRLRGWILYMRA